IPKPGDSALVIKAKREARTRAEEGVKMGLGSAEILADELLRSRAEEKQAAASGRPTEASAIAAMDIPQLTAIDINGLSPELQKAVSDRLTELGF
ncbi:MAG: hypothetical protein ACRCSU_01070, partial [Paracoccaceae bacterium]